jgi:hypothetical protein
MTSTTIEAPSLSNGRPLFAFAFRGGAGQALPDFAEADPAAGSADFVWVHLDLRLGCVRPFPAQVQVILQQLT